MKARGLLGFCLVALALVLTVGSGPVRGAQPRTYPAPAGVNAGPVADARWFIKTVDSAFGVGSHVSVAIDPDSGSTYISYYDATNKDLKMATYLGSGGNCGTNNRWSCMTVDSAGDVGQFSSIATDPTKQRAIGIAYHDATHGDLKFAERTCDATCNWSVTTIPYYV